MDGGVTFHSEDASRHGVVKGVAFEIAEEYFDAGVGHGYDAGYFAMGLSRQTIKGEDAVIHFEDAALDHHQAVHAVLDVELLDDTGTPIGVVADLLLVGLHVEFLVGSREHQFEVVDAARFLGSDVNDEAGTGFLANSHIQSLLNRLDDQAGLLDDD